MGWQQAEFLWRFVTSFVWNVKEIGFFMFMQYFYTFLNVFMLLPDSSDDVCCE